MPKYKVILTDLDGVLRTFPSIHAEFVERELGLEKGKLFSIAFQQKFLEQVVTGKITDDEWRKLIVEELAETIDFALAATAIVRWSTFPGELVDEVHQLYRALKGEYKIALLTNATTKLNDDLRSLEILELFDVIFNTSEIGFAKPDERVFHHVLKTIKHPAHEILFIDDQIKNIESARSLGFGVHLFKSFRSLKESMLTN
jgi:HAD superfamily hydrolase (TIGR01509 family)